MSAMDIGSEPIDFELKGTDGNTYTLSSFKEKKYLAIMFSCNHCPYVVASEREFVELQSEFENDSFQLIAINPNDEVSYPTDSFDNMVKRADEKKFNFPYLRDDSQEIAKKYNAGRTPEIFLYNQDRKLVYYGRINDNPKNLSEITRHDLKEAMRELISGKAISMPVTQALGCSIKWKSDELIDLKS